MKIKYLILFFIIFLASVSVSAQNKDLDNRVQEGINYIYNIRFSEAESVFKKIIADYPDNAAGRFFLAMVDWWKIRIDLDNETRDDIFFAKIEDVIYQCDEILKKNPNDADAYFFKGGAIGFRGWLRAFRNSWLKAANDGKEALPIIKQAYEIDPSRQDVQLGFGLYNYYAAVMPEQFPAVKPLMIFFPKGDKPKGIEQLNIAANKGKYTNNEAKYFLMTLYSWYEKDHYKAMGYAEDLNKSYPNNPVYEGWLGRLSAFTGNFNRAQIIFQDVLEKGNKGFNGYNVERLKREANYYIGTAYKFAGKTDSADVFLSKSLEYSRKVDSKEPSGFWINTLIYLGQIKDLQNKREEALKYYNEVLELKEYGSSHSVVKQYIQNPYK